MDALCAAADLAAAGENNAELPGAAWYNTGGGGAFAGLLARRQQQTNAVSPEQGAGQGGGQVQQGEGAGTTAQGEQGDHGGQTAGRGDIGRAGGLFNNMGAEVPYTPMAGAGHRQNGGGQNLLGEQQRGDTHPLQNGVVAALEKVLKDMTRERLGGEYIKQKLSGEAGKMEYKEEAVSQRRFQAYAYMQEKAADVKVVWGLGKYFNGDVAMELKGKVLGRMGDRTEMGEPMVVKLPEQAAWNWKKGVANSDIVQWKTFAEGGGGDNKWKLWQPTTANVVNIETPRMAGLPPDLALFLCEKKRSALEAYLFVCKMENEGKISAEQAAPLKEFFMVAGQCAPGTDSSQIAIEMNPVLNIEPEFQKWAFEHANFMLGPKVSQWQRQVVVQQTQGGAGEAMQRTLQQMTNVLSHVAREQTTASKEQRESKKKDEAVVLDEYDLAKLMGWSGVSNPKDCEPIWQELLACKGEANRRNLIMMMAMKKFAKEQGMKIDTTCFLSKEVLDDIVKQRPNETGVMATMEASGRGVSNLVVLGRSQLEIDSLLRLEEAMNMSNNNRTFREAEKQTKVAARRPPTTYWTLLLNVATFATFLRVLYGKECDLFKQVWVVFKTLEMEEVFMCRDAFTPLKCKEVTWAIYEECRNYFRVLKTPDEFLADEPVEFPEAALKDVYNKVRRQEHIWRSTFPPSWRESGGSPPGEKQGLGGSGGGSGGAGGGAEKTWFEAGRLAGRGGGRGGGGGGGRGGGAGGGGRGGGAGRGTGGVKQGDPLGHVNPKFLAAWPEFFKRFGGRVSIRNLMEAAGVTWDDMPKLPAATTENGGDALCWTTVLGVCRYGQNCHFAAAHGVPVPDDFAEAVIKVLSPGVEAMMKDTYKFPSQLKRMAEAEAGGGPYKYQRRA
eukprot:scaffold115205_cov57-Cyclotella_meneghiniana.AAC.3